MISVSLIPKTNALGLLNLNQSVVCIVLRSPEELDSRVGGGLSIGVDKGYPARASLLPRSTNLVLDIVKSIDLLNITFKVVFHKFCHTFCLGIHVLKSYY